MNRTDSSSIRAGNGTLLSRTSLGNSFAMQSAVWRHPWFTQVFWSGELKEWVAVVRPGFVNGRCPAVRSTPARMASTPAFLAPVTAWDGKAVIAQMAQLADEGQEYEGQDTPIWVPLYRNPLISLPWRELTTWPAWFTRRGVTATSGRRVMACDLVLHQPRYGLTSNFSFPVDLIAGTSIVTQTVTAQEPLNNDHLKVVSMSEYQEQDPEINVNRLLGVYEEPTWDEKQIARIYLVSPKNVEGSPDGGWIPFVQHKLFWNLSWDQPTIQLLTNDSTIPGATASFTMLASGVGMIAINSIWASVNDMTNQALNIVTTHSLAGSFWTPTGGGSDADFPDPTSSEEKYGLRKDLRLKSARMAALKTGALVDSLDPPFPYRALQFPIGWLS